MKNAFRFRPVMSKRQQCKVRSHTNSLYQYVLVQVVMVEYIYYIVDKPLYNL